MHSPLAALAFFGSGGWCQAGQWRKCGRWGGRFGGRRGAGSAGRGCGVAAGAAGVQAEESSRVINSINLMVFMGSHFSVYSVSTW